jgi:hypothetical protein
MTGHGHAKKPSNSISKTVFPDNTNQSTPEYMKKVTRRKRELDMSEAEDHFWEEFNQSYCIQSFYDPGS